MHWSEQKPVATLGLPLSMGGSELWTPTASKPEFPCLTHGPSGFKASSESLLLVLYQIPVTLGRFYCTKRGLANVALL